MQGETLIGCGGRKAGRTSSVQILISDDTLATLIVPSTPTILKSNRSCVLTVLFGILLLASNYADKEGVKLTINDGNETTGHENDLFGLKEIKIL